MFLPLQLRATQPAEACRKRSGVERIPVKMAPGTCTISHIAVLDPSASSPHSNSCHPTTTVLLSIEGTMAASTIPAFEHTSMDKIAPTCATTRKAFLSHKTRDLEYRKVQLRKLYWAFKDNASLVEEACKKDLGKSQFETYLTEISWVMNDCIFMANNLDRFAKDEKPADIAFTNKFMGPRIRKDPLGAVLIIGAYNFPIQLTIGPLIGAIAAGCTAIIKPSEAAPYAASVMQKILAESLDPECYTCVQGAVPETTALLDQKWDKIFYTGSENVAKIIAKKAAETLTPLTLELGVEESVHKLKTTYPVTASQAAERQYQRRNDPAARAQGMS